MMSVPVSHTINNWCPQITGSEPSGGWVCRLSVWGKHCGKYHICREKMQLSRAKPGNQASYSILKLLSSLALQGSGSQN